MSIKIDDDFMSLEIDGKVVATAKRRTGGWWEVSHWPRFFDRNQAITALTVTELLEGRPRQQRPTCAGSPRRIAMTDRGVGDLAIWRFSGWFLRGRFGRAP